MFKKFGNATLRNPDIQHKYCREYVRERERENGSEGLILVMPLKFAGDQTFIPL